MLPSIIVFLIVLSLLVFIHEFGHFLAAKKAGIKVMEFGFGYPPKIWGRKIGETIYSLNWIPFGGFVRLLGQETGDKKKLTPEALKRAFFNKSKKKRALVLLAGITGNFLLGLTCFTIIYCKLGIPKPLNYVKIVEITANSPAQKAGLIKDEQILAVNDKRTETVTDFMTIVEENKGKEISLVTNKKKYILIPRENPSPNEGRLGVAITDTEMVFYPWWQMPFRSSWEGLKEAMAWSSLIISGLALTIQQLFKGITPQVAGPLGIFQLTSQAAKEGILEVIQFTGILSINLAVLNLVPFPALDGGHLVLVFLGDFLGKKRREKIEYYLNMVGFVILVTLMLLITMNDVLRILKTVAIPNILESFSFLKPLFK